MLGWDPVAAEHNRTELAAAMARGCRAFVDGGGPAADVLVLLSELRLRAGFGKIPRWHTGELVGDPAVRKPAARRFWRRVVASVSPSELAAMGPVVEGTEHLGAWVLRQGQAEWVGVHEFSELTARLARSMRRAELQPGFAHDIDRGPIGA